MKKITFLLLFLGLLLSVSTNAQIPTVLTDADFTTKTGVFRDSRDGKYYAYKKYGNEDWFMQNLNWNGYDGTNELTKGSVGAWGSADPDGSKFGRFYPQENAANVCPEGWVSFTRNDLAQLTKDVSAEYSLPDLKDLSGNKYVFQNMLKYMRGGNLKANAADGLWESGTGELDLDASNKTQFNILPMGEFNGADYTPNFEVGKRTWFLVGNTKERFRSQHNGGNELSCLKHADIASAQGVVYGAVRCIRSAQTMKDQVIIVDEIAPKLIADANFNLGAIVTSGLALTYTSSDENVATVNAMGEVAILKLGKTTITISQSGNADFNPAYSESRVLSVSSAIHRVILPSVEGVITSPTAGNYVALEDVPFEFSVTVISGYEGVPIVKLNAGETLTAISIENEVYKYKIEGIKADILVTITGIQKIAIEGFPRFAVISDVYAGRADWEAKTTKALENLIAQSPKIDAIVITGNITERGTQSQYTQLKTLVDAKVSSDISVYYAMGNNDWLDNATACGDRFETTMKQSKNQLIIVRGYPIIIISADTKDLASSYSLSTKTFLEEKLAYAAISYSGKPIFVVQNTPNTGTVYGSAAWGSSNITSILEGYPQVISISGNSHYFLANELSIHQNKFTSINTGSVSFGRMQSGLDDGITPSGSETISEGVVVSANDQNAIEVKRIDFFNNNDIKQPWTITAPHDGTAFAYKNSTGGAKPYFETENKISLTNLGESTCSIEFPVAKDDDDVTQYLVEILDMNEKPLLYPLLKFTSDYYLATTGVVATTISKDVSKLVENSEYYVRVTAIDAFGQKSIPLLSDKITTKAKDTANPSVYDIISDRIRIDQESRTSAASHAANVDNFITLYKDSTNGIHGFFTGITYGTTDRLLWDTETGPMTHMKRLNSMAMAYVMPGNKYFESDDLHQKIVKSLQYWQDKKPTSGNWWHLDVGVPKLMGVILLEMRTGKQRLPVVLETQLIQRMEVQPSRKPEDGVNEGANRSDMALHYLYRACLTSDDVVMERAFRNGYEPIKIATGSEGIQPDGSYLLHGAQLQLHSYGQELINTSVAFDAYSVGTDYAIPEDKIEILSNFARNGYFKAFRGAYIHHHSTGRGISRIGNLKRSGNARYADVFMRMDTSHKDEYERISKRLKGEESASYGIEPQNVNFFVGDYLVHQRPDFSFSLRTASTRTVRSEYGNGESLQTYFLSDGSTSFLQNGDEYYNIPVGWNWTRIPGTTAPQFEFDKIPRTPVNANTPGLSTFTGGVSDSLYSANTYVHDDTYAQVNTNYSKAWFFFDNEIVCLGAGINSTSVLEVNTTVEQNLLKSDVVVATTEGEQTITQSSRGETSYDNNLKWVLHNNAGYYFPKGGKVKVENKTTSRSWYEVNTGYSKDPVDTDVFSIWFDHGKNPVDVDYAYIVVPNKKTANEMNSYDASDIEILSNTAKVQAVRNKTSNVLQVIFTDAGTLKYDDIMIHADKGAALILKNIGTPEVTMHVADPGQTRSSITITTSIPSVSSDMKKTVCNFAGTGKYAGASKVYTINQNSETTTAPPTPPYVPEGTPDFTIEIPVLEDTYVSAVSGQTTTNFGAEGRMIIKNDNAASYRRQSYVKLSLDKMDELNDVENIEDYNVQAYLKLYLTRTNSDAAKSNWLIAPVTDTTWSESTMTWNNRPAVTDLILDKKKAFNYVVSTEFNAANLVEFNITPYTFDEYNNNRKTIALNINNGIPGAKVDVDFATKENVNTLTHPRIVLKGYKKKAQTLDFVTIPSMTVGDADFALSATSSSGLPITYTSSDEGVIAIVEAKTRSTVYLAHAVSAGTATITATQAGDGEYVSVILAQEVVVVVVVVAPPVGIEENENATTLRVYANAQTIYVDVTGMSSDFLTNSSVKVYSSIGVELKTVKLTDAITPITIPTSGVYIIKVVSDGYKQEFKVIVK